MLLELKLNQTVQIALQDTIAQTQHLYQKLLNAQQDSTAQVVLIQQMLQQEIHSIVVMETIALVEVAWKFHVLQENIDQVLIYNQLLEIVMQDISVLKDLIQLHHLALIQAVERALQVHIVLQDLQFLLNVP